MENEASGKSDRPPFGDMPDPMAFHFAWGSSVAPDDSFCFQLWNKYGMLDNVRAHSLLVAHIATSLAKMAHAKGLLENVQLVRASALLHDLAKTYCLLYGGSHALLGASWALKETGEPHIAQGVILHVYWPWKLPDGSAICKLPFLVMYADKRVRHDCCVTITERFEDLLVRYGKTEAARAGILNSMRQAKIIEQALSAQLGINLDEYSFNCRRLVS